MADFFNLKRMAKSLKPNSASIASALAVATSLLIAHKTALTSYLLLTIALPAALAVLLYVYKDTLTETYLMLKERLGPQEYSHKLLFESLVDGIFVAQDYKFVFCNDKLPDLLGYTRQEFIGIKFEQVIAPNYLALWTNRFEKRVSSEAQPNKYYELQVLHRNGDLIWVELRAERTTYRKRPAVLGILRDISIRKLHEEKLLLAKAVFNSTQESLMVTDIDGNILTVNPAFTHNTEYSNEELVGQHMSILHSGKDQEVFYNQMWHSIHNYGSWQGTVWNRRKNGDVYQEWFTINTVKDDDGKPIQYVGIGLDISRIKHVETYMERMAHYDALTGLPNRLLLNSRFAHTLEIAKRDNSKCAVLFMDLDGFKAVNDTYGHAAGDELLKQVAERMKERLREIDTLARLGGDEFVAVLGISDPIEAQHVAEDIIHKLAVTFNLAEADAVKIGCSIGIALFPDHGNEAHRLMRHADTALYEAKRAGKNTWRSYQRKAAS